MRTDPRFIRPAEVYLLLGDASKAHRDLGWSPRASFEQLVRTMVDADVARVKAHQDSRTEPFF